MLRSVAEKTWRESVEVAQGPAASQTKAGPSRPRADHRSFLLPVVACAALVLPIVYSAAFYDVWDPFALEPEQLEHLVLNVACNLLVIVSACLASGHMERAIDRVLVSVFIIHAVLVFVIVAGRLYYSRPVLLAALCISVACGVGAVWLTRRLQKRHVAAIAHGLPGDVEKWLGPIIEVVRNPITDLRSYDLILINFEEDLPGPWAKGVSRAILAGAEVLHVEEYLERSQGRVSPDCFSIDHLNASSRHGFYSAAKRGVDTALIVLALPAVLLILCAAALAIAVTMGRPVVFVQDRIGQGGKIFRMYKLRTMRERRHDEPARATAMNDDRITSLGRLLRRYHVDEIPQMWNVLKGDMSLIGPRPEQPQLALAYAEQMPTYSLRHLVRPGITGWSQVCFGYAENLQETREKLAYDLHYVKYFGFILDLRIAMWTVGALISGASVR